MAGDDGVAKPYDTPIHLMSTCGYSYYDKAAMVKALKDEKVNPGCVHITYNMVHRFCRNNSCGYKAETIIKSHYLHKYDEKKEFDYLGAYLYMKGDPYDWTNIKK